MTHQTMPSEDRRGARTVLDLPLWHRNAALKRLSHKRDHCTIQPDRAPLNDAIHLQLVILQKELTILINELPITAPNRAYLIKDLEHQINQIRTSTLQLYELRY